MSKYLKLEEQIKMQKYIEQLKARLQERKKQLIEGNSDEEKLHFASLQDEIVALAELCREFCRICESTTTRTPSNSMIEAQLGNIEQIERIYSTAKAQMISGEITKQHLIEVAQKGKENLLKVCGILGMQEEVELLLKAPIAKGEHKDQKERDFEDASGERQ